MKIKKVVMIGMPRVNNNPALLTTRVTLLLLAVLINTTTSAAITLVKTDKPHRILISATDNNAQEYKLVIRAYFNTKVRSIDVKNNTTCRISIRKALLECPKLGQAPLDVIQDDTNESAAYLDITKIVLDKDITNSLSLFGITLINPVDGSVLPIFSPNPGPQPQPGATCEIPGTLELQQGTDCKTMTDESGAKWEVCCPATLALKCKFVGGGPNVLEDTGTVTVSEEGCTSRKVPEVGGGNDFPVVLMP